MNLTMLKFVFEIISRVAHQAQEAYDMKYKDTSDFDGEFHNNLVIIWGEADLMIKYLNKMIGEEKDEVE